ISIATKGGKRIMKRDILLEIGLEELPARFIDTAMNQLVNKAEEWLKEHRLSFKEILPYSTPRRLAIVVKSVDDAQETLVEELRGPSEKIAKDEDGSWSRAAMGFAKGQGKSVEDLFIKESEGSPYVFWEKVTEGNKTEDILPAIKGIIGSIQFPQTMYWDREVLQYARPIRWIVALYGKDVIPFELAKLKSGRETYGHRFLGEKVSI